MGFGSSLKFPNFEPGTSNTLRTSLVWKRGNFVKQPSFRKLSDNSFVLNELQCYRSNLISFSTNGNLAEGSQAVAETRENRVDVGDDTKPTQLLPTRIP